MCIKKLQKTTGKREINYTFVKNHCHILYQFFFSYSFYSFCKQKFENHLEK